jgi:glycosyltransferase involved in cell wall biosynthesis
MGKKYQDISITWEGDVTSTSGWAQHARGIIKPLVDGGASVRVNMLKPSRPEQLLDAWWEEHFKILTKAQPGVVKINHGGFQNANPNPGGGPLILMTHWETEKVPIQWVTSFSPFNEIWVPNPVMLGDGRVSSIAVPTRVVPFPINVKSIEKVTSRADISGIKSSDVVFGAVGQWNQRRNMSDLIIAYLSEFTEKDNVCLVIKTFGNTYENIDERNKISNLVHELKRNVNRPALANIVLLRDNFSYESFLSILRRFDIYCSTSRGESKHITLGMSAAMGKQCIYVDTPCNREFTSMNSKMLFPISYVCEPVVQMGSIYSAMDYWARPDLEMTARAMRSAYVHKMTKNLAEESNKLIDSVRVKFSPETVADRFAENYRHVVGDRKVVTL